MLRKPRNDAVVEGVLCVIDEVCFPGIYQQWAHIHFDDGGSIQVPWGKWRDGWIGLRYEELKWYFSEEWNHASYCIGAGSS